MIDFKWIPFSGLTSKQVYEILSLRSQVFVVEQNCVYLDPDGKDFDTLHLLGYDDGLLATYMRLFLPTESNQFIVFGRIVTAPTERMKGYGKRLMQEMLAYCDKHYPDVIIKCSAQYYLKQFYESFEFKTCSDIYDEDGIPHIAMQRF